MVNCIVCTRLLPSSWFSKGNIPAAVLFSCHFFLWMYIEYSDGMLLDRGKRKARRCVHHHSCAVYVIANRILDRSPFWSTTWATRMPAAWSITAKASASLAMQATCDAAPIPLGFWPLYQLEGLLSTARKPILVGILWPGCRRDARAGVDRSTDHALATKRWRQILLSAWARRPLSTLRWGFQENDRRVASTILTCVLWNIWKCRNAKVFRHDDESNLQLSRRCHEDLVLWSHRCSSSVGKMRLVEWSNFFPV